jgi:hypothetical protein
MFQIKTVQWNKAGSLRSLIHAIDLNDATKTHCGKRVGFNPIYCWMSYNDPALKICLRCFA